MSGYETGHRSSLGSNSGKDRGIALITVIVVLMALVIIATPFSISMRNHSESATDLLHRTRALKECIENDPALTGKILRVVNSSLFGLSREVSDLHQALGLESIDAGVLVAIQRIGGDLRGSTQQAEERTEEQGDERGAQGHRGTSCPADCSIPEPAWGSLLELENGPEMGEGGSSGRFRCAASSDVWRSVCCCSQSRW